MTNINTRRKVDDRAPPGGHHFGEKRFQRDGIAADDPAGLGHCPSVHLGRFHLPGGKSCQGIRVRRLRSGQRFRHGHEELPALSAGHLQGSSRADAV